MEKKALRHFSMRAALTLLVMLLTTATAWAWDGSGTSADPYLITSTSDLDDLATNVNSGTDYQNVYFKQTKDIAYSHTTDWNDVNSKENNYTVIGVFHDSQERPFKGHYDGQGHTISGIRIYKGGKDNFNSFQGIFGMADGADIRGITLADTRITGFYNIGGIVGQNYGTVSDCHVAADVLISAVKSNANYHGGIVGRNYKGTVSDCTSAATLTNASGSYYGGIAGQNYKGTLRNNVAIGAVVPAADTNSHGAICGVNDYGTLQNNCYYGCTVAGVENATGVGCENADVDGADNASPNHFEQNGNVYTIKTAKGWNVFWGLLANKAKGYFTGKTVKLNGDITVSHMAGASYHDFTGTFDGQGKTLTFSHTASDNYCAPFRYVQGASEESQAVIRNLNVVSTITAADYRHIAGLIALQSGYVAVTDCNIEANISCTKGTNNPNDLYPAGLVSQSNNTGVLTVSRCTTTGQIATDGKYAAGLIGIVQKSATIENCQSSVVIKSSTSGDGTHGGFVAVNNNSASLTIDGCVFDGKLLSTGTTATTNCGGFVGWKNNNGTVDVTNSLYTPAALESGETECTSGSATFVRNGEAGTNCHFTRTLGTAQGGGMPTFLTRGDGAGTSANPYKITNADDLKDLAVYVNGTGTYSNGFSETTAHNCSEVYFQQTNPITLTSAWTPIGTTSANPFKGHYDGGNFTISGLTVSGNYQYAGLFGFISSDYYHGSQIPTELKNINIVDCNIDVSSAGQGNGKAAGIASYVACFNMSNCKVSGTIKGYGYAAGLIGQAGSFCTMNGCFADVTVSAHKADPNAQYPPAYYLIGQYSNNMSASGNYYHDNGGNVSANYNSVIKNSATPLYMVTGAPSGVTVAATNATLTYNAKHYFASGATVTLTVNDADKSIIAFTATGAASSEVATDKKSATITLASSDVTVSATLQTVSGTTSDGLTWSLTQDNSGNYTVLTISGTGAMNNYDHTTVGGLWRTTAPWGYGLTSVTIGNGVTSIGNFAFIGCQSLATVTIGNSVATIGENAFDHCDALKEVTLPASVTSIGANAFKNCVGLQRIDIQHDGAVSLAGNVFQNDNELQYIVFPSIAAEQANTTGNWSGFTTKLRAKFGNQHFGVTTEGGTAAYAIATADDLRNLAAAVNAGNSGSGKTFRQTADIDLSSGGNFKPIGTGGSKYFSGTYDGGGKNISGLTVNGSYKTAGLFGCVSSGTVRNVVLVSPTVSNTSTDVSSVFVGTIAGDCAKATIENCHVINPTVSAPGNVYSTKSIGALIGYLDELFSITSITNNYVTNCYYYGGNQSNAIGHTDANSTVTRVSAAHLVNLGNNVTIQTAMADELGFTCDSDGDDVVENYWRQGAELTLDNTLGEAPEYYALNYATTAGTINGSTLTVGNADATVSAAIRSDGQPHSITYMKADGTTGQADAIALDGTETSLGDYWQEKWYFVGIDFSHTGEIRCYGDVHIILCDGKTMTVDGNGSHALWSPFGNFYFYGQNGQTGTLNATGRINAADNNAGTLTINGGIINATGDYGISAYGLIINRGTVNATGNDGHGIWSGGDLIINGGTVNATGGSSSFGIYADNDITLGWTKPTDRITASSYSANGTVKIADGQSLYNGSEVLSGTITDMSKLDGKTLRPYKTITLADAADNSSTIREWNGSVADVTLQGRTLTKDGNWNTLCLPFSLTEEQIAASPLAGATIKTMDNTAGGTRLDRGSGTLTLKFNTVDAIEAGKPYIIKWDGDGTNNIVNPTFSGVTISSTTPTAVESRDWNVTFVGQYSPFSIVNSGATGDNEGNKNEILLMTTGNKIGYSKNPRTLRCFRCHFYVPADSGERLARNIEVDFGEGETTSLSEELRVKSEDVYYTLDGRKLEGKPTAKGMYIVNGRKVIIK